MPKLEASPTWLKAPTAGPRIGVDRANRVILGVVIAQEGAFREPDPRGEFDAKSLREVVRLMKAKPGGLKSRFGHPGLSSDAAGSAIGRMKSPRLDSVTVDRDGQQVTLQAVRADLYLDASAFEANPNGNLGEYLLTVADSDPGLIGTSLVLQVDEEYRLNKDGTRKLDDDGIPLPPLWRPRALHASDITDEGAAVDQLLSPGGADAVTVAVAHAEKVLDRVFADADRETIKSRCSAWLGRYLDRRFGEMASVGSLGIKLTVDTSEFEKGLERAKQKLDAVQEPAAAATVTCPSTGEAYESGCASPEACELKASEMAAKEVDALDAEIFGRELDIANG